LRLLVSSAKSDLEGLAREARAIEQRKKWVRDEDARLKKIVETEAKSMSVSFPSFLMHQLFSI
jgi:tuftelin-interacting protein 11